MPSYKHVLIATDLTAENEAIISKGVDIAKTFGADLSFVHVVEPLPGYGYAYVGVADIENQLIDDAKKGMNKLSEKYAVPKDRCHVQVGPTKMQIMEVMKSDNIDLIIVGSHGRHGLAELLGSTAHAVVHGAPCDVMTIRIQSD
ncbi:MAG: universal stress protein [Gammaproteobacteria bacterium]